MIRRVETAKDLASFIDLPYRLHRRDLNWVPPFRAEVKKLLDRQKNPFFQHAESEYFIAEVGGEVVGRIVATHNRLHNEVHKDKVGFFGFFESVNDFQVAKALLDTASTWNKARGLDTMRGPMSFSINDECGLLIEGFDTPNALMMPHNPPYYLTLLETAGFYKAKDLVAMQGGSMEAPLIAPERTVRAVELLKKRYGLTMRPLNMKRFNEEVALVKKLYNACWEDNWGYVPMTEPEIDLLAEQFKPVVIPELVPFVEKDGEAIGFGLGLPDLNWLLRGNRDGRMFPAAFTMLFKLKFTHQLHRARVPLLGVIPAWRGKGIDSALYHWIWTHAAKREIGWGEGSWLLEDNPGITQGLGKAGFTIYKTYRILDRPT